MSFEISITRIQEMQNHQEKLIMMKLTKLVMIWSRKKANSSMNNKEGGGVTCVNDKHPQKTVFNYSIVGTWMFIGLFR